jgi:hypothetical protein
MYNQLIQAAQLLHTTLVRMGHAKRARNPVLGRMLRIIAKFLASHNAVEEGATHNLAGVSEALAQAFREIRDAPEPTPEQLESLYDAWRHDAEPNRAEVEGVIEEARKAEPDKTWKARRHRRTGRQARALACAR